MTENSRVSFRIHKLISERKRGRKVVGAQITAEFEGRVVTRQPDLVNGQLIGFHPDDNTPMLHRKAERELEDVRIRHRGALELVETCEKNLPENFVRGYMKVQILRGRVSLLTLDLEGLEAQARKLLAEDRDAAVREARGLQKIVQATETGLAILRREKPLRVLYVRGS